MLACVGQPERDRNLARSAHDLRRAQHLAQLLKPTRGARRAISLPARPSERPISASSVGVLPSAARGGLVVEKFLTECLASRVSSPPDSTSSPPSRATM